MSTVEFELWLVHEPSVHVDSNLLCGMFSEGTAEQSGTAQPAMHHQTTFDCGLRGPKVRGDDALSKDMVSSNFFQLFLQKLGVSTILNVHDTISHSCESQRFSPVLHPLLSEIMMGNESQYWWLLDPGAAATVMATASRAAYSAWVTDQQNDRFRAANGSPVTIDGFATVAVWVEFKGKNDNLGKFPIYRQAKLKCLVGGISHNIISTNTLCACGWNSIKTQMEVKSHTLNQG